MGTSSSQHPFLGVPEESIRDALPGPWWGSVEQFVTACLARHFMETEPQGQVSLQKAAMHGPGPSMIDGGTLPLMLLSKERPDLTI